MSALAVLFKESGWQVSGSDTGAFEPIPSYLKKNKITFYTKYSKKNIPKDVDLIVVGNNSPLSAEENPETRYATESGMKMQSLPETVAMLAEKKENIVVVGSLGKSTVTGMLAWCLTKEKRDPSYFIGALPLDLPNSSHIGKGKEFVIEGDEYASSTKDRRSKFLHFNPASVLLTSGLHDHINMFPTEESYKAPYKTFVAKIPKTGLLIYAFEGKNNKEIVKHAQCKIISYGLNSNADWYAENIHYGMKSSFDLVRKKENTSEKIATIKTQLLGTHNIENIVGVAALLLEEKKITPKFFSEAIATFHGIKNRIELKTKNSSIPVYQAFGPSYAKAKSVFDTLRLHFGTKRIVTVFEPHAFSWRNRKFLEWYQTIFDTVDEVIMLPATGHGKKAKDQLTSAEVWREAKKYKNIHIAHNEKEALQILRKIISKNDVIALVSSGPIFGLTYSVPKLFAKADFSSSISLK